VDHAARGLAAPQLAATTLQYCHAAAAARASDCPPHTTSEHAHLCLGTHAADHPIPAERR